MRQPEDLLEQELGEVLEGVSEDKVANPCVFIGVVMAEVDKVLDVIVGPNILDLLKKTDTPEIEEEQIPRIQLEQLYVKIYSLHPYNHLKSQSSLDF